MSTRPQPPPVGHPRRHSSTTGTQAPQGLNSRPSSQQQGPPPNPFPLTLPIITAIGKPEALQPSASSAGHLAQLLSLVLMLLKKRSRGETLPPMPTEGGGNVGGNAVNVSGSAPSAPPPSTDPQYQLNALISHPQLLRVIRAHIRTGDPPAALPAARLLSLLLSIPLQSAAMSGPFAAVAEGSGKGLSNSSSSQPLPSNAQIKLPQADLILKRLHTGTLITGSAAAGASYNPSPLLGDLWGMLRAQDPMLTPPCVACLHALAAGPCWLLAGAVFVVGEAPPPQQQQSAPTATATSSSSSLLFILRKLHATAQHRGSAEAMLACILSTKEGIRWAQRGGNDAVIETTILGSGWLEREWRTVKDLKV